MRALVAVVAVVFVGVGGGSLFFALGAAVAAALLAALAVAALAVVVALEQLAAPLHAGALLLFVLRFRFRCLLGAAPKVVVEGA